MSFFVVMIVAMILLGLTFGSFVNAAVWRIHQGRARSLLNDRSECTHCHHKLAPDDLIPVVSWVMLRGKCRYCGKKIDDTPLPELGVAAYFLLSFLFWPTPLTNGAAVTDFVFWLVYGVLLAILFVYDLKYMILPNKITYTLIGLALIQLVIHIALSPAQGVTLVVDAVFAVASIAGVYLLLYVVSNGRWVGFGDVKLGVFLGIVLGDWKLGVLTFLLANLIGCFVILPGLITKVLTRTSRVPFGPFLITAFVISVLFGDRIVDWYLSTLML